MSVLERKEIRFAEVAKEEFSTWTKLILRKI